MKTFKNKTSLIILSLLFAISCSVGVKKDLLSGLNIKYNGFTVMDSYLVKDKKKTTDVKIKPGQDITLVCAGLSGFKAVDGKVYPGASIIVTDSKGHIILEEKDLFAAYDSTGVEPALAEEAITIKFTAPTSGSEKGDKYSWKSKIWDKKSESNITAELELEVE